MRRVAYGLLALLALGATAEDRVYLRDGRVLAGRVLSEPRGAYLFQPGESGAARLIPPQAVMFVLYGDPVRAQSALGIPQARRHTAGEQSQVQILPTRAFGHAILEAVQNARTSIWISAYHLSGSRASPIQDFYEALQRKAQEGVEVVIIAEFGPGTSTHLRSATYNFVQELGRAGIRVRYLRERKVLHKKLIIVDGREVILGSSNLTMAGTLQSTEINARVTEPTFVARAVEDFRRLLAFSEEP